MLCVDKGADATLLLLLSHAMQRKRGLAGRFRAIDLDNPSLGKSPDPQRNIETQRSGRCRLDLGHLVVAAKLHDRTLAELAFDLCQRRIERLLPFALLSGCHVEKFCRGHCSCLLYFIFAGRRQRCLSLGNNIRKSHRGFVLISRVVEVANANAPRRADAPIPDAASCLPLQRDGSTGPWPSNSVAEIGKATHRPHARSSCHVSTVSEKLESNHVTFAYISLSLHYVPSRPYGIKSGTLQEFF